MNNENIVDTTIAVSAESADILKIKNITIQVAKNNKPIL